MTVLFDDIGMLRVVTNEILGFLADVPFCADFYMIYKDGRNSIKSPHSLITYYNIHL